MLVLCSWLRRFWWPCLAHKLAASTTPSAPGLCLHHLHYRCEPLAMGSGDAPQMALHAVH